MFEKQYKETFSQVVASDSLMQEVLNLKNKRHKKIRMMTLLAAVMLIFALATTAFAYTGFVVYDNPGQMLEAFFGKGKETPNHSDAYISQREELNEEAAEEYVAPYIFEVGQSITHNGNTLTVDAATYDPYTQCGVVYMRLENPNGVPSYTVGMDGQYAPDGPFIIRSNINGEYFFVDQERTTDTSLVLACYLNKGDYMKDAILKLHLEEDTQEITIPLEATETMEHITLGNGGIQLSPIGLVIHGDKLGLMRGTETHVNSAIIRYADGSEYLVEDDTGDVPVVNYAGAMIEPGDGYTTNRRCVTYLLNRVVPLKDVTEVIVDGVNYSVDAEPIDTPVVSGPETTATGEGIYAIDPTFTIHANNDPVIGQPLEFTEGLYTGKLTYSVTGAEIIHNIKDIPLDVHDLEVIPDDLLADFSPRRLRAWNWLGMDVLDYINEKGDFLDDHCLVLVYATVESHDAVSSVSSEPTWFLANYLELENTADGSIQSIDYFSEAWGDWYTFDHQPLMLMSGENDINYTAFGFYVDKYLPDGTPVDFSSFCVRGNSGDAQNILIPLGLETP